MFKCTIDANAWRSSLFRFSPEIVRVSHLFAAQRFICSSLSWLCLVSRMLCPGSALLQFILVTMCSRAAIQRRKHRISLQYMVRQTRLIATLCVHDAVHVIYSSISLSSDVSDSSESNDRKAAISLSCSAKSASICASVPIAPHIDAN